MKYRLVGYVSLDYDSFVTAGDVCPNNAAKLLPDKCMFGSHKYQSKLLCR